MGGGGGWGGATSSTAVLLSEIERAVLSHPALPLSASAPARGGPPVPACGGVSGPACGGVSVGGAGVGGSAAAMVERSMDGGGKLALTHTQATAAGDGRDAARTAELWLRALAPIANLRLASVPNGLVALFPSDPTQPPGPTRGASASAPASGAGMRCDLSPLANGGSMAAGRLGGSSSSGRVPCWLSPAPATRRTGAMDGADADDTARAAMVAPAAAPPGGSGIGVATLTPPTAARATDRETPIENGMGRQDGIGRESGTSGRGATPAPSRDAVPHTPRLSAATSAALQQVQLALRKDRCDAARAMPALHGCSCGRARDSHRRNCRCWLWQCRGVHWHCRGSVWLPRERRERPARPAQADGARWRSIRRARTATPSHTRASRSTRDSRLAISSPCARTESSLSRPSGASARAFDPDSAHEQDRPPRARAIDIGCAIGSSRLSRAPQGCALSDKRTRARAPTL
jgi:hypothetical protein